MQCTANVIAIGQLCMFFILFHYDYEFVFSRSSVNSLGATTTTTMQRENGIADPPPKWNSLCLSVFDQLAKSSKWINLKTKNRPQQRAVRKHRKHPWCEKESMPHLDSIDGAKKTTICSVLSVIWNWSEWDRLWGHQGIATIYSRRIIWVFWCGGAVASGGMWVSQDRGVGCRCG